MRNEHGTDRECLPLVYGCHAAHLGTLLAITALASAEAGLHQFHFLIFQLSGSWLIGQPTSSRY